MSDMIPLDEAIEAAGLCLFGDDWIGPQPEPDKEFLKKQIAPYAEGAIGPLDKSTAERLDRIIGRGERSVLQRCFTIDAMKSINFPFHEHRSSKERLLADIAGLLKIPTNTTSSNRSGPKPRKQRAAAERMIAAVRTKKITASRLDEMDETSLGKMFGVSRRPAKAARERAFEVLGQPK